MRVLTALYLFEICRRYSPPCYAGSNGYNFHKSEISFALLLVLYSVLDFVNAIKTDMSLVVFLTIEVSVSFADKEFSYNGNFVKKSRFDFCDCLAANIATNFISYHRKPP